MVVTMNRFGEVCQIAKLGGVPVDAMTLLNCINMGRTQVHHITTLISKKLDEDMTKREVGGLIAELTAENER